MLLIDRTDRIAIVTLNRPEAMNALSRALRTALRSNSNRAGMTAGVKGTLD